jgi:hypothetical protein
MVSSGLLRRVALVRTDVLEEPGASFIRVIELDALGTTQAATSNRRTLRRNTKEALSCSETSVLTRATRPNIPEGLILHSRRRENLRSYISLLLRFQLLCGSVGTILRQPSVCTCLRLNAILVTYVAHCNYFTAAGASTRHNHQGRSGLFVRAILNLRFGFANLRLLNTLYRPTNDGQVRRS